jgi:serine/threonine-protein kinase
VDVIDAKSMRLLGSASLEQSLSGVASVDDDAVHRIASILRVGIRPEGAGEGSTLASAYQSYLEGRGYLQRFDKPANLDTAIRLFNAVVYADPKFALGYSSLGEAYWYKYRYDQDPETLRKAAEYCNRAVQLNDKLPAVYTILARVHDSSGNRDLALEEFDKALQLDPRNADAHLGRAGVYEGVGRIEDAEKELQTAITLRPAYWVSITELGSFYFRHRRPEDALREYRRALDLVPDSASAHSNYGVALKNNGRPAEAETEFKRSLQINETYFAYANYGMLLYRQKNWAEAARMTEKALQLNSNNYLVWANLGISYEQLGDYSKAAAAYKQELIRVEELAKIRGDDPVIQLELAVLYSKNKMRDQALRYLNASLARTPSDPRILSGAAEVYDNLGERGLALTNAKKALAAGWTLDKMAENPGLRNLMADPRFPGRNK